MKPASQPTPKQDGNIGELTYNIVVELTATTEAEITTLLTSLLEEQRKTNKLLEAIALDEEPDGIFVDDSNGYL